MALRPPRLPWLWLSGTLGVLILVLAGLGLWQQRLPQRLRNAAKAVDGLEGSIGRVSGMAEDAGKAMGSITNASRTVAEEAVQLREATQALIKRLQAA